MPRKTDPFPTSEEAKLAAEFERVSTQTAASLELRLAQVSVATASLALAVVLVAWLQGNRVVPSAWVVTLLFIGWYGLTWFLVRRGRYLPWMRWVASTVDTALVTFLYASDATQGSAAQALLGSGPPLYLLAIVATMLRTEPALALYSGISGSLQFMLVSYLVVFPRLTPEQVAMPEFARWLVWQKAAFMLGAGFMARAAGRRVRRLLTRITWDAVEREALRGRFGDEVVEGLLESGPLTPSATTGPAPSDSPSIAAPASGTTLFVAGLANFTKVAGGQRPEEAAALRSKFVDLALSAAQAEGGRVDRFLSDGVLAVFEGSDDAARAVRASRALVRLVKSELGGKNRVEVGLDRVGGHDEAGTGEPRSPNDEVADTLNTASRLRDDCRRRNHPVLFTREVKVAAGEIPDLDDLGWAEVPGLRELLPLHALKAG